jgi:hypothetical protein
MAQLLSYNFSTVENPLSDGGNFTIFADSALCQTGGSLQAVAGNKCQPNAAGEIGGTFWSGLVPGGPGSTWPADQYSEITIATEGSGTLAFYLILRAASASAGTYYVVEVTGTTAAIFAYVGGTIHVLSTPTIPVVTVGDTWRATVTGNVIKLLQNGTVVASFTDTNNYVVSGSVGFAILNNTSAHAQINLWAGGSAPASNDGGLSEGTLMGSAIVDLDGNGFPIAESQIGTLL